MRSRKHRRPEFIPARRLGRFNLGSRAVYYHLRTCERIPRELHHYVAVEQSDSPFEYFGCGDTLRHIDRGCDRVRGRCACLDCLLIEPDDDDFQEAAAQNAELVQHCPCVKCQRRRARCCG